MSITTQKHTKRRNGHQTLATPTLTNIRIALYGRVSTDDQCDRNTIQGQLEFLRDWARLYQLPVYGEYADEGISGTIPLEERPDGERLLADAKAGNFGTVVVYRVDRFARSLRVLLDGYNALEVSGVAFKSTTEPFDTATPMGKFLFQLLGSMAELERSTIIERMNMGRDRVARAGQWTNGPIPLGYDLDAQGYLIPSERLIECLGMTEAALAIDIFHRIARGSTSVAEAQRLNTLCVPPGRRYSSNKTYRPDGQRWLPSRIAKMIRSTIYSGRHTFESRYGSIERTVPVLVDEVTWSRANEQLCLNQKKPKANAQEVYLLRGLLTCARCEATYVGQRVVRPGGKVDLYYRCGGRAVSVHPDPADRCRNSFVPALTLETTIWERCCWFIKHPGKAIAAVKRQADAHRKEAQPDPTQKQKLTRDLAVKHQERERIKVLFHQGGVSLEETQRDLAAKDVEIADLRTRLDALDTQQYLRTAVAQQYEEAKALLIAAQQDLEDIEARGDREAKQQLIAKFLNAVRVEAEEVEITYRFQQQKECVAIISTGACRSNCHTLIERVVFRH